MDRKGGLLVGVSALLPEDTVPISHVQHPAVIGLDLGIEVRHGGCSSSLRDRAKRFAGKVLDGLRLISS